jgi:tetratricopeptide (TPR) repeat protein
MKKHDLLKFHFSNSEGEFDWGKSRHEIFNKFYNTDELNSKRAEDKLKIILKEDPEFIDAYNSLGWLEMNICNYGNAMILFEKAFKIGNSLIPKSFKGKIIWGITENRPFLRALQGLGLSLLFTNEFEKALKYFQKTLKYNPNDNQGIRALMIHCYMALGDFKNMLKICSSFPEDTMADTLYGKVFALYHLERINDAKEALHEAQQYLPLVSKELISNKHKPAFNKIPGTLTCGGKDEAYDYWKRVGQFWTNPKLKFFLTNFSKKTRRDDNSWIYN